MTDLADLAWLGTMLSDQPVGCLQQPAHLDNTAVHGIPRTHIHCVGATPAGITQRPVRAVQPNGSLAPSRSSSIARSSLPADVVPAGLPVSLARPEIPGHRCQPSTNAVPSQVP
ncbi:hypothetical protein ACQPXB_44180 [Amycolatopsis sp. CA-161197]|uniref:hypothetical protein n=1 Tax=Amycolatopsis sp. CA-161197 TaxID=3239922 RepID=UPI003D938AD3